MGKRCKTHYRGTLNDGTVFDSSYDRGEPLEFVCGMGMMIRGYDEAEVLPWDTVDVGVSKQFLLRERKQAYDQVITPDCRESCSGCGANCLLEEGKCDA